MVKSEEPLNEVSLNTNDFGICKIHKLDAIDLDFTGKDAFNVLDENHLAPDDPKLQLKRIANFIERGVDTPNEEQISVIHQCLPNIYRHYIQKHSIPQINCVVKSHLRVITKYLKIKNFNNAEKEVISLYNSTNSYKVHDLGEILLADRTICNEFYLTSLKILTMEIIIKSGQFDRYDIPIIKLFSYDTRFLLNDVSLKTHIVVKLLLNFFSLTPKYKVLFGLKFLQYVNQFKLEFRTYVKNMDVRTFSHQLMVYASREPDIIPYLNSFYLAYSRQYQFFGKIMLTDLLMMHKRETPKLKTIEDICTISDNRTRFHCLSIINMDDFISLFELFFVSNKSNNCVQSIPKKIRALCGIWVVIVDENFGMDKRQLRLLDKTLNFVNDNLLVLKDNPKQVLQLILLLIEYCFVNEEFKRISNIVNVLINGAVIFEDYEFVRLCCKTETTRHLIVQSRSPIDKDDTYRVIYVFEKLLSLPLEFSKKRGVFSHMFNIYTLYHVQTFSGLLDYCQKISIGCLRKLGLKSYHNFLGASEVMAAILYSNCKDVNDLPTSSWSPVTNMLYGCLSGKIDIGKHTTSIKTKPYHFLSKRETLIKVVYYFNLELARHSVVNLLRITRTYIEKCIKKLSPSDEKMSVLERDFFISLLNYLNFNNLHRLLIELVETLKPRQVYFQSVWMESQRWLASAFINLELENHIRDFNEGFDIQLCDTKEMRLEKLLTILHTKLELLLYFEDTKGFQSLFIDILPFNRKELFDINNTTKLLPFQYVKVLIFNIKLFNVSSILHFLTNDIMGAVSEGKKSLKLAMSLIKKQSALSQISRLALIKSLIHSYTNMINIYVKLGISADANFYSKELSRVIASLGEPAAVFEALYFCHEFYSLTEQSSLQAVVLEKLTRTYKYLDVREDIVNSSKFLFIKGEHEKLLDMVLSYFDEGYKDSLLPVYWRLKLGELTDSLTCPSRYRTTNLINLTEYTYSHTITQLQQDPFFKGLLESTLAIPSCIRTSKSITRGLFLHREPSGKQIVGVTDSPRSSNMTPKSKHIRQKFDKVVAVDNLNKVIRMIEGFDIAKLDYPELLKYSSAYILCYSMLSNIGGLLNNDILQYVHLADLPRYLPLYFSKLLSRISLKSSTGFKLSPIETSVGTGTEINKIYDLQKDDFCGSEGYVNIFNVISIDICPTTGNLILVKYDGYRKERECLMIPLGGRCVGNSSPAFLSFNDAAKELQSIIKESNNSTSIEVTSKIKTAEQRREWWEKRYSLDDRLHALLKSIEKSWFNGIKGFFSDGLIDPHVLTEFKDKFNEILHCNLPSRRRVGNSSMFLQLQDWVVELFLKIDPQEENFISMMEDLIYFVLDILQYHGEENAYDEIDMSMLHVQLEEIIKRCRSQNRKILSPQRVGHTFLIIGSKCHLFPWESLSFMRGISITRIPSLAFLSDILKNNSGNYSLQTHLEESISIVLNPNGDLQRTEQRFIDLFNGITETAPKSRLIVSEKPSEELFLDMMGNSTLFIYVGHGGGEQFVRSSEIKKLNGIAPSFLLGCSSAAMQQYGNLSPSGIVYSYLQGGSPLVIGNLWDVTDKDIDIFSMSLFEKTGLAEMACTSKKENKKFMNVSEAIDESRDSCHLKYLNGAAPVAYGLPMSFIFT